MKFAIDEVVRSRIRISRGIGIWMISSITDLKLHEKREIHDWRNHSWIAWYSAKNVGPNSDSTKNRRFSRNIVQFVNDFVNHGFKTPRKSVEFVNDEIVHELHGIPQKMFDSWMISPFTNSTLFREVLNSWMTKSFTNWIIFRGKI